MKIRNGFVSNSSSSSFMIYGTMFEDGPEVLSRCKFAQDLVMKDKNYRTETREEAISFILHDPESVVYHLPFEVILDEDFRLYIGQSWDTVKDEETGKEFKNRIEEKIKEIFPEEEIKFNTHQSW